MHKLINACLMLALLVSAYVLYSHEHATRDAERQIAGLKSGIADQREAIKVLGAEWASLTRPDRLQTLSQEHLKLRTPTALQFVRPDDLASRIPKDQPVLVRDGGKDAIADIIKEMQQ
jgi:cell division protein FtsL